MSHLSQDVTDVHGLEVTGRALCADPCPILTSGLCSRRQGQSGSCRALWHQHEQLNHILESHLAPVSPLFAERMATQQDHGV